MDTNQMNGQLIVVGSSAGGVEALSTLVASVPADFPAPIVIAQHLEPQRPSHLGEILSRRSILPVHTILDHEPLQAGIVYVVPADQHVEINDGHIMLRHDSLSRPKPSVNLLFSSAAQVYGDGLIAVILTGTGSDGAAGALEVKKAGGTVVIQNPATAPYPAMPRSLAPTTVDFVANIEDIGALLYDLLTGAKDLTQPSEAQALQTFLQQLHERSGLDFTTYKMPTIQRRLQRRMVATGTTTLAAYRRHLQRHPEEYSLLISSFLIKVTEFFRDRDLFTALREQVIPDLIAVARERGNELRIWSAGCATGEEAYSLAILVADILGDELEQFTIRIFATDLDNDAITFARRGIYPASALATLPSDYITRFFHKADGDYEVQKRVRGLVIFGQHDLGQRAPFPRIDLVLCRNVLIYFTQEMQKRVLQLFAYSLRDGGYLVLGKAETTSPLAEFFVAVQPTLKIYRRQGERLLIPVGQLKDATPLRPTNVRKPLSGLQLLPTQEVSRSRTSMEKLGALVFNLPIGVVVVDRRYDIQIINSYAHGLLGIHRSAIGEDLLHLAENVPTKDLRAIIDSALRAEALPSSEGIIPIETETGDQNYLHIVGYPHQFESEDGPVASVLLMVSDVTTNVREQQQEKQNVQQTHVSSEIVTRELHGDERLILEQQQEIERLAGQVQRLMAANRELREANQDLTATNVELHQANEEYLVNTEEVQAAAEEVETLNEELQATNEELETLNEELQATVEELNTTNDDLEARSAELRDLVREREGQRSASEASRSQLEAILVSMSDAVLVVDSQDTPILVNTAYTRMFGDASASFAIEDEQGNPIPVGATPRQRAAHGENFTLVFTMPSEQGARHWFEAIGQPIRSDGITRGGVVVIRDITDRSLRRMQDEFLALASHELRTPLTSAQAALQFILKKLVGDPANQQLRRQAEIALRQLQRLGTLVNDLTDIGRLQTGNLRLQLTPLDLGAIVAQTVEAVQITAPDRQLRLTRPAQPLRVHGDALRLEQIVLNLLANAIIHAPKSQQIDIRLRRVGNKAELQIQDYGDGIPAERLPLIFSRYFHDDLENRSGLGVGLFITHELVAAHGGTVTVESPPDAGATFTVLLPVTSS
jgi:two-component system, chemotaxis family, CheB/CheR fusion protein